MHPHAFYELANRSMALPVSEDSLGITGFRMQLQRYLTLTEQRAEPERYAQDELGQDADFKRLQTLPGIGPSASGSRRVRTVWSSGNRLFPMAPPASHSLKRQIVRKSPSRPASFRRSIKSNASY